MADKYVDVSLTTGANDGTSPANAWQSLTDVLDGTPTNGALSAGDVVHIRTADDSGNNLSETRTIGLTTPSYPTDNPVIWKFDNGTIWPTGGVFIYSTTSSYAWTLGYGNVIDAYSDGVMRLRLVYENDSSDGYILSPKTPYDISGVQLWRGESISDARDPRLYIIRDSGSNPYGVMRKCEFRLVTNAADTARPTARGGWITFSATAASAVVFEDCNFIMNQHVDDAIFDTYNSRTSRIIMRNCTISNTASHHKLVKETSQLYGWQVIIDRTDIGLIDPANNIPASDDGVFDLIIDGLRGTYDFFKLINNGIIAWDGQGNYPTLNAILPTGDPWSIKVWPHNNNVSQLSPFNMSVTEKVYNQPDAQITVSLEMLIKRDGAFANPTKDEWWIEVSYWGTDGKYHLESSKSSGALSTSTASWSSTSYGANSYDPYKIEHTTSVAVKQNTMVRVELFSTRASIQQYNNPTGDFYFVDPDVQFS